MLKQAWSRAWTHFRALADRASTVHKLGLVLLLVMLLGGIGYAVSALMTRASAIRLALVAPMDPAVDPAGQQYRNFIELYLDKVNAQGGVNGRKLVLDVYDDGDDPEQAREQALEVVADGRAVAVIGHHLEAASLAAADIYREHGIAAISPGSGAVELTRDNDWYFRSVMDDEELLNFLVLYVRHVMGLERMAVISDDRLQEGLSYLSSILQRHTLELVDQHLFRAADENLERRLEQIVAELKQGPAADVLLLAANEIEAIELLKRIRDQGIDTPIVATERLATSAFQQAFVATPRRKPSADAPTSAFYTDGLFVVSSGSHATANEYYRDIASAFRERYGESPEYYGGFAFDAAVALVHALEQTGASGKTLAADRQRLQQYLRSWIDPRAALSGITGPVYFDANGDMPRHPIMLQYRNNSPITALSQFTPVELSQVDHWYRAISENRLVRIKGRWMQRVDVVYTGIEIRRIHAFDEEELSYDVEFDLWFRHRGELGDAATLPENIRFLNSTDEIRLSPERVPLSAAAKADGIKQFFPYDQHTMETEDGGQVQYRVYRIRGRFDADYRPRLYHFRQHSLGIHFRHRNLNKQTLIYTPDILGMQTQRGKTSDFSTQAVLRELIAPNAISPGLNWNIIDWNLTTDTIDRDAHGHPRYLDAASTNIHYSRFNFELLVNPAEFRLRGGVPREFSGWILAVCTLIVITTLVIARYIKLRRIRHLTRIALAVAVIVGLLSIEVIILGLYAENLTQNSLERIDKSFGVLWWLLGAIGVIVLLERLVWQPLSAVSQRPVAQAVRFFVRALILFAAFLGITAFVFEQQITSVLATSGVVTVIVGLAIQSNIANAFAGLVLNVEQPFRIGDWVRMGESEGQIVEVTWRSTRLRTWDGNAISIPNDVVIQATSINYGTNDDPYTELLRFSVDIRYPPAKVESTVTQALLSIPGIQTGPGSRNGCRLSEIADWSATYTVVYTFQDYSAKRVHRNAVMRQIWDCLNSEGIMPAIHKQEVHMVPASDTGDDSAWSL